MEEKQAGFFLGWGGGECRCVRRVHTRVGAQLGAPTRVFVEILNMFKDKKHQSIIIMLPIVAVEVIMTS